MKKTTLGDIHLFGSDLADYLSCTRITRHNLEELFVTRKSAPIYDDDLHFQELLKARGNQFEMDYLTSLKSKRSSITEIDRDDPVIKQYEDTLAAMQKGDDIIYQAKLGACDDRWQGYADFLIKVEDDRRTCGFSYEVHDCKLSATVKGRSIIQLMLYTDLLSAMQDGIIPRELHIVKKKADEHGLIETFQVSDLIHYYEELKQQYEASIDEFQQTPNYDTVLTVLTAMDPVDHCVMCKWSGTCKDQRIEEDHLSLIAGISSKTRKEFRTEDIDTLTSVANLDTGETARSLNVDDIKPRTNAIIQAKLQHETSSHNPETPMIKFKPDIIGEGYGRFYAKTEHDIYLDLESDIYIEPDGLTYLFGWVYRDEYNDCWAESMEQERDAFFNFISTAYKIWKEYPEMHIYHYGHHEHSTFIQLIRKYGYLGLDEISLKFQELLNNNVFSDLHRILTGMMWAGTEGYSIKEMEKLYGFSRTADLAEVRKLKSQADLLMERNEFDQITDEMTAIIKNYNEDDCRSLIALQDYLESIFNDYANEYTTVVRPIVVGQNVQQATAASPILTKEQLKVKEQKEANQEKMEKLKNELYNLASTLDTENEEEMKLHEQLLKLIELPDFFEREDFATKWEYFKYQEMTNEEKYEDSKVLKDIVFREYGKNEKGTELRTVRIYDYPDQPCDIQIDKSTKDFQGFSSGKVNKLDTHNRQITLKTSKNDVPLSTEIHIAEEVYPTLDKVTCLIDLSKVIFDDIQNEYSGSSIGNGSCSFNLFMKRKPKYIGGNKPVATGITDKLIAEVSALEEGSVYCTQGPPGTGKSTNASKLIAHLLNQKQGSDFTIGITALSHAVMTELMQKVYDRIVAEKIQNVKIFQKVNADVLNSMEYETWPDEKKDIWTMSKDNSADYSEYNVIVGTSFMWVSKPVIVDLMIVDEAGQLSLADTMCVSDTCKRMVMFGDPQQLQQPQKAVHPFGTDDSALGHIFGGRKTVDDEYGLLLDTSYRMHDDICGFVSEMFYDGKLMYDQANSNHEILNNDTFSGSGMRFVPAEHEGNKSQSNEEVEKIMNILEKILDGKTQFRDKHGNLHKVEQEDIKIISPYNAQRNALERTVHSAYPDIQIGTVDKFQGQEAPIVIFSTAASTPDEAPKGLGFLFNEHRLNVAISRAKAMFVLVSSPALFGIQAKKPAQIVLANRLLYLIKKSVTILLP